MSTELALPQQNAATLAEQADFARMVTSGQGQSLLPDIYRGNPANVLIAVGLGASMGLSPAESLYRISVIKGKPSAGAELIAANVRKAGHRLRVVGDETTCTATIIRADDPDFVFEVTRDLAWAKQMGLATNDNYRKQPGTMLQWRAITACARLACPEALYGVSYTPDELAESSPRASSSAPAETILTPIKTDRAEPAGKWERPGERYAHPVTPRIASDATEPEPAEPARVTDAQIRKIGAAMRDLGMTDRTLALQYVSEVAGRDVPSRSDLTRDEASRLIDQLESDLNAPPTASDDTDWPPAGEPQR